MQIHETRPTGLNFYAELSPGGIVVSATSGKLVLVVASSSVDGKLVPGLLALGRNRAAKTNHNSCTPGTQTRNKRTVMHEFRSCTAIAQKIHADCGRCSVCMSRPLGFNFSTVSAKGMWKFTRTSKTGRDIGAELSPNHIVLYATSIQPVLVVEQPNDCDKLVPGNGQWSQLW